MNLKFNDTISFKPPKKSHEPNSTLVNIKITSEELQKPKSGKPPNSKRL